LAEIVPRQTQRLYELVDRARLDAGLAQAWVEAEERLYAQPDDPMVNWDVEALRSAFGLAGLDVVSAETWRQPRDLLVSQEQVGRWFGAGSVGRPSYAEHLRRTLSAEQLDEVRALLERQLLGQVVAWQSSVALLVAKVGEKAPQRHRDIEE
jgi:putative ATPase